MLAVCAALWGCKKGEEPASDPAPAQPSIALPTRAEVPAAESPELRGSAGMKLPHATVAPADTSGSATRCTIEPALGESACDIHVARDVAVADGAVYFVDGERGVRRYVLADGEGCVLRADTAFGKDGLWPLPEVVDKGQKLDGPVYMRSGGPKFALARAGDGSIYAYDFLGGAHRVFGKTKPAACVGVLGLSALAFVGKQLVAVRGREVLKLEARGKTCKAGVVFGAGIDPMAIDGDGDGGLIVGGRGDGEHRVARMDKDGKTAWTAGNDDAFAEDGMCSITAVTRCGDAVCVADGNCKKLVRFDAATGAHVGTWKYQELFGPKVYQGKGFAGGFASIVLEDGGACTPAVFRLP
jgi:hypothetical protein